MKIEVNGINELALKLEGIADETELTQAVAMGCMAVVRDAKTKAPKDTGALRRSITFDVTEEGDTIQGIVYTPLEYAPYVEYGTGLFAESGNGRKDVPWRYQDDEGKWISTKGQHPQPYLRPALEQNKDKIINYIKGALK